jgi:hypothetical protein
MSSNPVVNISTTVISDGKLGIVTVQATGSVVGYGEGEYFGTFTAVGSAKATPDDKYDPAIGAALATSRALKALSRQIARDVHDEVHHRDKVRERQQEASEAAQKRAQRRRQAARRKHATRTAKAKVSK